MGRWRVVPTAKELVETGTHYTAEFEAHNCDSGEVVRIEYTQRKGTDISDAIEGLRALSVLLYDAATGETDPSAEKLN